MIPIPGDSRERYTFDFTEPGWGAGLNSNTIKTVAQLSDVEARLSDLEGGLLEAGSILGDYGMRIAGAEGLSGTLASIASIHARSSAEANCVLSSGALQGATTLSVSALKGSVISGDVLLSVTPSLLYGLVTVTQNASAGATTLTVAALPSALPSGTTLSVPTAALHTRLRASESAISAVATSLTSAQGEIVDLRGTLELTAGGLSTRISALSSRLGSTEAAVTSIEQTAQALELSAAEALAVTGIIGRTLSMISGTVGSIALTRLDVALEIGDTITLLSSATAPVGISFTLSAAASASSSPLTIQVEPKTLTSPVLGGTAVVVSTSSLLSRIRLEASRIDLSVSDDSIVSRLSIALGSIDVETNIFKSSNFAGGNPVSPSYTGPGWALLGSGFSYMRGAKMIDASVTNLEAHTVNLGGDINLMVSASENRSDIFWTDENVGPVSSLSQALAGLTMVGREMTLTVRDDLTPGSEVPGTLNLVATNLLGSGHQIWTAGNDGPGSGLNADLLDGRQASDFPLIFQGSGAPTTLIGAPRSFYTDTDTSVLYYRAASTWSVVGGGGTSSPSFTDLTVADELTVGSLSGSALGMVYTKDGRTQFHTKTGSGLIGFEFYDEGAIDVGRFHARLNEGTVLLGSGSAPDAYVQLSTQPTVPLVIQSGDRLILGAEGEVILSSGLDPVLYLNGVRRKLWHEGNLSTATFASAATASIYHQGSWAGAPPDGLGKAGDTAYNTSNSTLYIRHGSSSPHWIAVS